MKNSVKPNAMKVDFNEDKFVISFAEIEGEDHPVVNNEIELMFLPKQMMSVINPMIEAVIKYQREHHINLGINERIDNHD